MEPAPGRRRLVARSTGKPAQMKRFKAASQSALAQLIAERLLDRKIVAHDIVEAAGQPGETSASKRGIAAEMGLQQPPEELEQRGQGRLQRRKSPLAAAPACCDPVLAR